MTIDDILRLLRHRIRIEIVVSLDERTTGDSRYTAKCEKCGETIGTYTSEDSAKRALRSHAQHCSKGNQDQDNLFNWIRNGDNNNE